MTRVFLDIETLPPGEEVREQLAVELMRHCVGNHQASATTAVAPEEIESEFRKLALSGEMGRVLAVGVIVERDNEILHRGVIGRDRATRLFHLDEARTLNSFWRLLNGFNTKRDLIIGHNIFDFDLSFLYKRSVIHRVRPPVRLSFARYRSRPIYDTMCEWNQWSFKGASRSTGWLRRWASKARKGRELTGAASTTTSAPAAMRRSRITVCAT